MRRVLRTSSYERRTQVFAFRVARGRVRERSAMHSRDRVTLFGMHNPIRGLLHGSAALLSIAGAFHLWGRAEGDVGKQCALLVFAASLVALYSVSSLYHAVPWSDGWKDRMQRADHAMIYVLVAGTYTPIAMVALAGGTRLFALAAVWGIAAFGIVQKIG